MGCVNRIRHFFGAFPLSALTKHVQSCYVEARSSGAVRAIFENRNIRHIVNRASCKRSFHSESVAIFTSIYRAGAVSSPIERAAAAFRLTDSERGHLEQHHDSLVQEAASENISIESYILQIAQKMGKAHSSDKGLREALRENPSFGPKARQILKRLRADGVVEAAAPNFKNAVNRIVPKPYQPIFKKYHREIILSARAAKIDLVSFVHQVSAFKTEANKLPSADSARRSVHPQYTRYPEFSRLGDLLAECHTKHQNIRAEKAEKAAQRRAQAAQLRVQSPSSPRSSHSSYLEYVDGPQGSGGHTGPSKYRQDAVDLGYGW